MKIKDILRQHPSIIYPELMEHVVKPLNKIGITYFSHARVNKEGELFTNASNPQFLSHYYQDGFYHYDLHNAKNHRGQRYFLWDLVTRVGQTEKMYQLGMSLGVGHVFTIIEENGEQKDWYHFATKPGKNYMNEFYLQHIDLLEQFIVYFKDQLLINNLLNRSYSISCKPLKRDSDYYIKEKSLFEMDKLSINEFLTDINAKQKDNNPKTLQLPQREMQCAYLLLNGNTTKEISAQLNISPRTVEIYFERLKGRLGCKNKIQLAFHLARSNLFT